jgi:hypothetical protein
MEKTTKQFIKINGKTVVQTITIEPLSDTGCIYLALPIGHKATESPHCIYKLHSVRDFQRHNAKEEYRWVALWNTCCHTGPFKGVHEAKVDIRDHPTIEAAIDWAEGRSGRHGGNYKVIHTNFSELVPDYVVDKLYRMAEIKR